MNILIWGLIALSAASLVAGMCSIRYGFLGDTFQRVTASVFLQSLLLAAVLYFIQK